MHTNRQTLWNNPPALATHLGGVGRVHGGDLDTSFFRFVFKHLPEQSEPCIIRGQGKMPVSVNKTEGKVFNRNQIILSNEPRLTLCR